MFGPHQLLQLLANRFLKLLQPPQESSMALKVSLPMAK
jgi:hypothetical protein